MFIRRLIIVLTLILMSCSPQDHHLSDEDGYALSESGEEQSFGQSTGMRYFMERLGLNPSTRSQVIASSRWEDDQWTSARPNARAPWEDNRRAQTFGMNESQLRSRFETAAMGLAAGEASGYFGDDFFSNDTTLAPDSSVGERVQHEFSTIMYSNLRRQTVDGGLSNSLSVLQGDGDFNVLLNDMMNEFQFGMVNDAINLGLDNIRGWPVTGFQNLEGEFILRKDQSPEYALTTIQPLYGEEDENQHSVFTQASLRTQDDTRTGNLGLAYRYMTEDRQYLYGVNSFLDYEWPDKHARMSFGVDAMTSLLGVHLNRYFPLTDWRDTGNGYQERGMAGWDGGVTGRLESFPSIQLAARGYVWEREEDQGDLTGVEAGFDYNPFAALQFGVRAGHSSDEDLTLTSTVGFRWMFDEDATKQLEEKEYALNDVSGRRFEKVQRENRILKQSRQDPSLTASVLVTVGANTAERPDGTTVSLAVGMRLPFGTIVAIANAPGALAELTFGNGGTLILGQNTIVQVNNDNVTLAQGIMRFVSGSTDITVNIPGGTVQLTGTDIDVRSFGGRTTVRVRDGGIRVQVTNGTQNGARGDTILVDANTPTLIPFSDPDAETHRMEAHEKLDRSGQNIIALPAAAPYVTGSPTISNFTGNSFDITLPFSKAVNVVGTPILSFNIGGILRTASVTSGSGTEFLTFSYSAVAGDIGESAIVMDSLAPEASIIAAADSGQNVTLTILHENIALPGTIASAGGGGSNPTITSITPSAITTNANPIVFAVTFSETVTGFDASDPVITNGTVSSVASVSGTLWNVSVTPTADGAVSITIPANSANNAASMGNLASATVSVTSDTTAPVGYAVDFLDASVTNVNADAIAFSVSGGEVGATLDYSIASSGGGTPIASSVVLATTVQDIENIDVRGLPDGTLTVTATLTDARGNQGLPVTDTIIKTISSTIASSMSAPAANSYGVGENLDFSITFPSNVTVTNTPRLALTMGASTVYANYVSGSGSATLLFRYVVALNDNASPLAFASTSIDLNGGTLVETATSNVIDVNFTTVVPTLTSVIVDTTLPSGYAVVFVDDPVNGTNETSVDLSMTSLEVGATYNLSISSNNGGTPVTSTGTVSTATTPLTLNLSGLNDGTLTATLSLTDVAGNVGADVTDTVTKITVASIATSMSGPAADTYALGENLDFSITFPSSVTVTNIPRLALTMGASTVYANYVSGSGTSTLLFRYVVVANDNAAPLAFSSTSIDLNGGTIIEDATSNPINLNFSTVAPVLTSVNVDTAAPLSYAVTFVDNPVNGTNETSADLSMTSLEVGSTYNLSIISDNGGTPVTSTGTVSNATTPLTLNLSGLNDGTLTATLFLTDISGNVGTSVVAVATKATTSLTALVSTASPVTSANPILFTVTFSESVATFEANDLNVVNGTAATPTTSNNVTWSVNVTPAGDGTVSVQVLAGSVANGVGTLNLASNTASTTSDRTPPTGQSVAFDAPLINVGGMSAVGVTLSGLELSTTYDLTIASSGGGSPFSDAGNVTAITMQKTYDLSSLTDGTLTAALVITDANGNIAGGVNATSTKVTTLPALTAMTGPANGYYNAGKNLSFTMTWNQSVTVVGTPRLALNMNGTPVYANYASGSGTSALVFTVAVPASHTAAPLTFGSTSVDLNGGTINATISGNNAGVDFTAVAPILASVFVDTTIPTLDSITPPSNRVYVTGDAVFFNVTFNEPMVVTGTPRLALTYGATTVYANYLSGSGTASIGFSYVVQSTDIAPGGLTINNSIDLNGGTIVDRATNIPAALTFTAPTLTGVQMNVPSCAGGTVQLGSPFLDGYCAGRINIGVNTFDLIVAPAGCGYESGGTSTTAPTSLFSPSCSGSDTVTKTWSSGVGTTEGGASVEDGLTNTVNIIGDASRDNPAAAFCYRMDVNGRTDWYLPARNELDALRQNLGSHGLLGFVNSTYWSSSETGTGTANIYDMSGGLSSVSKTSAHNIRCVRRITPPQIVLNPNPAPGKEGLAYNAIIAATGGGGSLTFTLISGTLPPGLTLNSTSGTISGTPTTPGLYPGLIVRASDAYGQSETNPFSIEITGLPRCNNNTVVTGTSYGGGLCGAEVTIASQTYDLVVTNSNCAQEASGTSATKPLADFTPTCTGAVDGQTKRWASATDFNEGGASTTDGAGNTLQHLYDGQTANAGAAYCHYLVHGGYSDWYLPSQDESLALYNNMAVNGVGGFAGANYLTSTQSAAANGQVVNFTNGVASAATKTTAQRHRCVRRVGAPLRIVQPTTATPGGAEGIAYILRIPASGGTGAITFSLVSGTLPAGLTLNTTTGVISGTPTLAGVYSNIVIRATDASANTANTTPLSITITGLAKCAAGTVTAGAAYQGGICAGVMANGGSPYDLVATVSRCAYEAGGTATNETNAEFTPACTGAADTVTKTWSNINGTNELATSETDGIANTQILVGDSRRDNPAAAYCYHLVQGGHNDWYLPAREELDALYTNLQDNNLGGFAAAAYYSSTQTSTTQARYRSFSTGVTGGTNKDGAQRVRCVRRTNPVTPLRMQTTIVPSEGAQGLAYSLRIPATSDVGAITFSSIGSALPAGLTLNSTTGFISGTPTVPGTYPGIIIQANDTATTSQTTAFTIVIAELDSCSGGTIPSGDAFGGGLCIGNVTIASENYDLVTTLSNCGFESGGSATTEPVSNFNATCNNATDSVTKRWTIGANIDEATPSTTDGAGNTLQLMADNRRENPAAGYCQRLVTGGHDDWYLPSEAEMLQVFDKVSEKGIGGFANATYWTSTQLSTANARTIHALTGASSSTTKVNTTVPRVRCVRRVDAPLRVGKTPRAVEGQEGVAFTPYIVPAQGGVATLSYSISPSLPTGLTLNSSTGVISGTTSVVGTVSGLVVSVTDGVSTVSTDPFDVVINARARCTGNVMAGNAFGGGICGGNITVGASLPFDLVLSPSGCGFEPSGTVNTKPAVNFTPTCTGGTDTMNKRWGSLTTVSEGATSVDDGIANTLQLLSDGQSANAAAAYCFRLNINGFDDWYLPSQNELDAVYQNLGRWKLAGLEYGSTIFYQSSTEVSAANSRRQNFDKLGAGANTAKNTTTTFVRCVRRN